MVKSKTKSTPSKNEDVVDDVVEDVVEEKTAEPQKRTKRPPPTQETILEEFENIIQSIDDQIQVIREEDGKPGGIKFLRQLNKSVKALRNNTSKVIKKRVKSTKKKTVSANSGFLKPVPISGAMAEFAGWEPDQLRSRVDVTKYICNYISENNLQNPDDKREIKPDNKLQKLLKFNPESAKAPLRYYSLQSHLKQHFLT